LPDSDCVFAV